MHNIELSGTKLKAWVHYGDNFPLLITAFEDDGVTPKNLTGQVIKLGIEKNNVVIGEIVGIVNANEVLFNIDFDVYSEFGIEEGATYKWDYWSETNRETAIYQSDLEFKKVSHKTEV